MKRTIHIGSIINRFPKLIALVVLLAGTMILDAIAYGLTHSCSSCISYFQFLTTPTAASAPILASISSIVTLTNPRK